MKRFNTIMRTLGHWFMALLKALTIVTVAFMIFLAVIIAIIIA